LQPRTKLSGCSTSRISSHLCICNICLLGLTPCALHGLPHHGMQEQTPFLFARTAAEAMAPLDDRVHKLQNIGLQCNTGKTIVVTSGIQPPSFSHSHNGNKLRVLQQNEAQKWLGCMINAAGPWNTLQAASRVLHANKWTLCDKGLSILHKLRYFEKVISPVACFGAPHRATHEDDVAKLDVEYRRLMRMVVGPPADANWASPWHEILYG